MNNGRWNVRRCATQNSEDTIDRQDLKHKAASAYMQVNNVCPPPNPHPPHHPFIPLRTDTYARMDSPPPYPPPQHLYGYSWSLFAPWNIHRHYRHDHGRPDVDCTAAHHGVEIKVEGPFQSLRYHHT